MAGIQIETKLRPCYIINKNKKKKALFHGWFNISDVVGASPMVGGHPGGTVSYPIGIVELEDGSVVEVEPINIKFIDNMFQDYCLDEKMRNLLEKCRKPGPMDPELVYARKEKGEL